MKNQEKNSPKSAWTKYRKYLNLSIYLLIIGALLYFSNVYNSVETIGWKSLKNDLLIKEQVSKFRIVDKSLVEVYIKEEYLGTGIHSALKKSNQGPHYSYQLGSISTFENKLETIKKEYSLETLPEINYYTSSNTIWYVISWLIPILLLIAFWNFILRRSNALNQRSSGIFDFGKSRAKVFTGVHESKVTFKDVAGLESAKEEVKELVDFLKNPNFYTKLGAKIPKGIMLVGPPGTGKTLLAKAVAGETKVPFFSISGSEFVEMFVGVGASRVRDLFDKAKKKAPSIIFIDEIDAVGKARTSNNMLQNNDERDSTLNQLLAEMDGFEPNSGVIVLAATNRPEILDKALLRPGRFDRHIYLELPSLKERKDIFAVHSKKLILAEDFDLELLASQTPGFSGADIANVCNEAALIAARKKKNAIHKKDFSDALDRIIGGLENKGKFLSDEEKKIVAFHEAGHATASWFIKEADELLKVSIVPRGKSLGAAWYVPEENHLMSKKQLFAKVCTALAGRASEQIFLDDISTGAMDDLEKVTKIVYTMVAQFGLSERIGNLSFHDSVNAYQQSFNKPYSEYIAKMIDQEVQEYIYEAFDFTLLLLSKHENEVKNLAWKLMEEETVDKEQLIEIFGDRKKTNRDEHNLNHYRYG